MLTPPFIATRLFDDPAAAPAQVRTVYESAIAHLRGGTPAVIAGADLTQRVHADNRTFAFAPISYRGPTRA